MEWKKVLVVDDELPIRESMRMFEWSKYGYKLVGEARHGLDALKQISELQPHIVITDIEMPVMDGLELTKEAKERNGELQFIYLTCHSEFDYARQAVVFGVSDYLIKGVYREEDLVAALERAGSKLPAQEEIGGKHRREIEQAIAYVERRLGEEIGIADVADHVGLSNNYFGSLFRKETGAYFQDYLKQVRMEQAAYYLRNTNMKIYEIAERVGFPNQRYFSEVFVKLHGVTPREFRGG